MKKKLYLTVLIIVLTCLFSKWALAIGCDDDDCFGCCPFDCAVSAGYETHSVSSTIHNYVQKAVVALKKDEFDCATCTGTLIRNLGTLKNYIITAEHCISGYDPGDEIDDIDWRFFWNLTEPNKNDCGPDTPWCGSTANGWTTISDGIVRMTNRKCDIALVELDSAPDGAYYAGWSRSTTLTGTTVNLHHAVGDIKQMNIDTDGPTDTTGTYNQLAPVPVWWIDDWEVGQAHYGTSGSVLISNSNGRIVGATLNGTQQEDTCTNDPPQHSYFTKFSYAWDPCDVTCCKGMTGNVDGDSLEIVDGGDLAYLIGYLFDDPPGPAPECMAEGNMDGDLDCLVDLSDLTALIDYLFISFTPPAGCGDASLVLWLDPNNEDSTTISGQSK